MLETTEKPAGLVCIKTGKLALLGSEHLIDDGKEHAWVPVYEGEPYFTQTVGSSAEPTDRTADGRFDRTHLSPEHAWRLGRDYLAHCIRYGFPMKVIKESVGAGARILEMGCGKEVPLFRVLTCDHSAVKYYKPSLYVGADLNIVKYNPRINGCETHILSNCNLVDELTAEKPRVPDVPFDVVVSFEVLEHMGKHDGLVFLDAMVSYASRKPKREGKPGLIVMSTPVNGGLIAKNHVYEWNRGELRRAFEERGCQVLEEYGTFSNLHDLERALTPAEREVWNSMARYHSPHTMSCFFSAAHPEVARNIAWKVQVPA